MPESVDLYWTQVYQRNTCLKENRDSINRAKNGKTNKD